MDEKQDEKIGENLYQHEDKNNSSKKFTFIVVCVLVLSAGAIGFFLRNKDTKPAPQPPQPSIPYALTPSTPASAAGATQSFTVTYPVPGGWQSLSDASFYVAGGGHDQWVHYNPGTKKFTLQGATGSCTPGQAAKLSTKFLIFNCSASSTSGSESTPTITFSLTPQQALSGVEYRLAVIAYDQDKATTGALVGTWTVK